MEAIYNGSTRKNINNFFITSKAKYLFDENLRNSWEKYFTAIYSLGSVVKD